MMRGLELACPRVILSRNRRGASETAGQDEFLHKEEPVRAQLFFSPFTVRHPHCECYGLSLIDHDYSILTGAFTIGQSPSTISEM